MFNDERLVEKHGSWVRVQVEFYDFLFQTASAMCESHFREKMFENTKDGKFSDGNEFYEIMIGNLEGIFKTEHEAWEAFLESERR